MNGNTERFLERATVGLATDPELRLDVQAELRSHIEDKIAELGGDEHADEAVASLGEVVDLAEEVSEANQRRLGWRNLARRALRFGLVPLAVFSAVWFSDISVLSAVFYVGGGSSEQHMRPLRFLLWLGPVARLARFQPTIDAPNPRVEPPLGLRLIDKRPPLTKHEILVLFPDFEATYGEPFRELWEENPTNQAYYAKHISSYMNNSPRLQQALEAAETVDPDNGRYPLIAAVYQAEDSAELIDEKHEGQPTTHRLEVIDRGKLDDAMAQVLRAIAKPHFHPYGRELAQEKASIIGTPRRFLDTVQATDLTQSYETPNIQAAYSAAKYSLAYARLLMQEGRDEEAVRFLHATEQLARRLAPESEALINLVIIRALLAKARDTVPEALREMGRTEEAEETHKRLLAILAPLKQDRAEGSAITQEQQVAIWRQTGVRVERDWPALGRDYSSREFLGRLGARNKMLFVGVAQCLAGYLGLWLLVAMLACVLISVRWRLALGSQSAPLLLLPSWTDICRYILCGTVLPIVLFVAWSQLPLSGMGFSPGYAGHRTAAAFLLLSAALLVLPAWLAARAFVRRCAELDLCPPPPLRKPFYLPLAGAVVLFIAAFCPSPTNPSAIDLGMRLNGWGTATLVLFFALVGVHALWGSRTHGRAMGTVSRSLVIVFASASLLLSAALQPLLHARERSLVRHWRGYMDEELMVPKDDLREIDELRDRTVATMAANPMPLQTD